MKTTITKKQIQLSKDVLDKKKLYWSKGSVEEDIEQTIIEEETDLINEYGHNFDFSQLSIWAIETRLRKMGYRIFGDK